MLLRREGGFFKKRGRVLKKRRLVRGKGGGPLLQKWGGDFLRRGGLLKKPVEVLKEFDPPIDPLCVSLIVFLRKNTRIHKNGRNS